MAGVAFMTVMALLIGLSIAIYQKAFTPVTMVTIKADRAGLQLAKFGDVRLTRRPRGQVRAISKDGKQAVIKVALRRRRAAKNIPENVSVEILPDHAVRPEVHLVRGPGGTLAEPRAQRRRRHPRRRGCSTNVELQKILADLFPLLRSIRPADLSSTLYALATALRGRGDRARRDPREARLLPDRR